MDIDIYQLVIIVIDAYERGFLKAEREARMRASQGEKAPKGAEASRAVPRAAKAPEEPF